MQLHIQSMNKRYVSPAVTPISLVLLGTDQNDQNDQNYQDYFSTVNGGDGSERLRGNLSPLLETQSTSSV
jgi:hypothetical protein